jgi:hypothetical protein
MPSNSESIWYKLVYYGLEFLGKYYSTYSAVVTDNNDPLKMNRVKVIFPQLVQLPPGGIWALPKGVWGGKNYGMQLLPEKGDVIYVEFSHGDLEYPIWSHGSYGQDEIPGEFTGPNVYGFKTPKGNIVLIDDNDNTGGILVKSKTSNEYVKITTDTLELEAKLIKLGKEGKEQAILGNTLNGILKELINELSNLSQAIETHSHPSNNAPTTTATSFTSIKTKLGTIKGKLDNILSNKVKLD